MAKGQMYRWVTETRNFLGGSCPHQCDYCYVKSFKIPFLKKRYSGGLTLLEKELAKPLGSGKLVFVCSCNDLFAADVPVEWINRVLLHCNAYQENTYLFQTKNPMRFLGSFVFPKKTIFGTTIESNREDNLSNAPCKAHRFGVMTDILFSKQRKIISIEPILDFDLEPFVSWIKDIKPEFVSIGADSKRNNLPEPSWEKTKSLIEELKKFTEVKMKPNLKRLQGKGSSNG